MRTRHLALLLVGTALWALLRVVLCYDEAPWQPVLYDYYHIDLGELSANQDQGGFGNSRTKIPAPMDAIVDVINDLGIKLLAIHNEHNENNIAISPYGAFSVLAALSEGLQGDSFHEILHSARIPHDKQLIRVGLRDIHRHLKSYFIPEEGFLAGLTLNLNNISLKSEYEDVLRFYGFDYNSFNNALYPDPPTTRKTVEGTTLETGFGVSDDTTSTTTEKAEETTVSVISKGGVDVPTETPTTTTTNAPTTTTEAEIIDNKEELTTTTLPPLTTTTTTETPTTTTETATTTTTEAVTTSTVPATETSVIETLEITATSSSTTPNEELGTSIKSTGSTAARVTSVTSSSQSKTATGFTTTKMLETTAELHSTTSSDSETASTNIQMMSVTPPESETTTKTSENTVRTTREISTSTVEPTTMTLTDLNTTPTSQDTTTVSLATLVLSTKPPIDDTTTFETTSNTETTASETKTLLMESTTSGSTIPTILTVLEEESTSSASVTQTSLETIESATTTTEIFDDQSQETTTAFFFGTTNNFQENDENLVSNYNYEENPVYNNADEDEQNANLKRSIRSPVVDYVIARHKCRILYDESQFVALSQRTHYLPEEGTTFAVYGKYREPAAFMKYDTVLPYMFVPNLNSIALSFPLDSTKYYLLLLLPLRDDGVDQLICDLRLYGNLRFILENLRLTHVEAIIPSFTLKGYVTLTPTLQKLGIRKIFEPRQSDFSPMTNASDIYVTNIEQAVTVTIRNYLDPSAQRYKNLQQYPPVQFKADHPFLYFVVDSELHVALMVGKVINPLNTRIS